MGALLIAGAHAMPRRLAPLLAALVLSIAAFSANPVAAAPESTLEKLQERQQVLEHRLEIQQLKIDNKLETVGKDWQGSKESLTLQKDALETARKSIDWWLTLLTILLAVAGFYTWRVKQKIESEWEHAKASIQNDHTSAKQALEQSMTMAKDELRDLRTQATDKIRELHDALLHARRMNHRIEKMHDSAVAMVRGDGSPKEKQAAIDKNRAEENSPQSQLAAVAMEHEEQNDWAGAAARWLALTDLDNKNPLYWFNYAYALDEGSKPETRSEAEFAALQQAWLKVVQLEPDNVAAFYNWGNLLAKWGDAIDDKAEKLTKYAEAQQRYQQATSLDPQDVNAFNNWSTLLINWIHELSGEDRAAMLQQAEQVLQRAYQLAPKDTYNLACLSALQGQVDEASRLLEEAERNGTLPDYQHLQTDRDMQSLQQLDWFQALLERVKPQEAVTT